MSELLNSEIEQVKKIHKLPLSYLLYVGTIEKRKNLLTIIKSLQLVNEIPLIVVGKKTSYFKEVQQFILKNNYFTTPSSRFSFIGAPPLSLTLSAANRSFTSLYIFLYSLISEA